MAEQLAFRVPRWQLENSRGKLALAGLPVSGDSGEVDHDGCRVKYSYDSAGEILTLTVLEKPRWVPMFAVRSEVRKKMAAEGIREA